MLGVEVGGLAPEVEGVHEAVFGFLRLGLADGEAEGVPDLDLAGRDDGVEVGEGVDFVVHVVCLVHL